MILAFRYFIAWCNNIEDLTASNDAVAIADNGIVLVHARGWAARGLVEVYYQRYAGSDPAVAIICL